MATLYLMFVRGGELAGLERGSPTDTGAARIEAHQLLAADQDLSTVEIWSGGRLLEAVGA